MLAVHDSWPARCRSRKLERCLDRFRSGICEERLVKVRNVREQLLGKNAGERRYIHLHEIGKFAVKNTFQRVAHRRMDAPDRKHPKAAEEIEITGALAVVEILTLTTTKTDIIADRTE